MKNAQRLDVGDKNNIKSNNTVIALNKEMTESKLSIPRLQAFML